MVNDEQDFTEISENTDKDFVGVQYLQDTIAFGLVCETFESGNESIPEIRVITRTECKVVLGQKICIDVPVSQKRTCTKKLIAQFCLPSDVSSDIKRAVKDCIVAGIAAGVLVTIIASPTAFLPVLINSVKLCLIAKGIQLGADSLKLGLWVNSSCSDWKDV